MTNPTAKLPTSELLAQALESLNDPALADMIAKARAGYYDDYKSTLATPQVQLVHDLRSHGHPELVGHVMDGEFDATQEEAQAWINSPEGQDILARFLRGMK